VSGIGIVFFGWLGGIKTNAEVKPLVGDSWLLGKKAGIIAEGFAIIVPLI